MGRSAMSCDLASTPVAVHDASMNKTNITMLSFGRPRLLEQAVRTLQQHTPPKSYRLTMFNDEAKLGTGAARNEVIRLAEKEEGRLDYLYLSDLDVAFTEGW